jgi:hypothetical protein
MKRAAPRIAACRIEDRDDHTAMTEALGRLQLAAVNTAADVVADLSPSERARLAVYCYGRAHLNAIGLAIAAQCTLEQLVAASHSAAAGGVLYAQSRDASGPSVRPVYGRRVPITLARSVPARAPAPAYVPDALTA